MRELERQHDDKLNIIRSMAASNTFSNEHFLNSVSTQISPENEHQYQNQAQQYHRVEMIISQNCQTPTTSNSHRRPFTPNTEPMNIENGYVVVAHPRQQQRRSRSLSEVWLEHRPQGTVQTGEI